MAHTGATEVTEVYCIYIYSLLVLAYDWMHPFWKETKFKNAFQLVHYWGSGAPPEKR